MWDAIYKNTEFVIMSNVYLTDVSVSAVSLCSDMSGVGGSEMLMSKSPNEAARLLFESSSSTVVDSRVGARGTRNV